MADQVISEGAEESGATDGKVVLKAKADTLILKLNQFRTDGVIVNEGAHDAWLSFGSAAAKEDSGIYLKAEGGSASLSGYDGEVRGIATEETTVSVAEVEKPANDEFSGTTAFVPKGPSTAETHAAPGWEAPPHVEPGSGQ